MEVTHYLLKALRSTEQSKLQIQFSIKIRQPFTINPVFLKSLATCFKQITSVHYHATSHTDIMKIYSFF